MPNRIIKDSIRVSDSIDSLSWFEEVLFYRLIVSCDDYGRFDGRIAIIKGTCFPLKDLRNSEIEKALDKLSAAGMVMRYEVDKKPYLQLIAWQRHQTIRAQKSKYPSPDDGSISAIENNCTQTQADVPVIQSNPIQSESNPNPIRESYSGDARLDEAFREYAKFRKQIKKPMTEKAVQLALGKLKKMSGDTEEQIAILEQSILNGWQGLFPLKKDGMGGATENQCPVVEKQEEDRFESLGDSVRADLVERGIIDGQSLCLGDATEEDIALLREKRLL